MIRDLDEYILIREISSGNLYRLHPWSNYLPKEYEIVEGCYSEDGRLKPQHWAHKRLTFIKEEYER